MTFNTFVGLETEYGVAVPNDPSISPVVSSALVVNAYRQQQQTWTGFDYTDEEPLQDARQPRMQRRDTRFYLDDFGIPNLVLTNGARLYVDHAHPEYSTPECASPRELLAHEHAGDAIMRDAAAYASLHEAGHEVLLHKNNTDGKGAAYGTHENYLISRDIPFGALTRTLMPFFVSRCVFVGAGRTGSEHHLDTAFQLTQRAEFFEVEVGLETTVRRGIMNTRDEPHADATRYRRLHVINGDANMCEVAGYLKVGTMMLLLDAYAAGYVTDVPTLLDPVQAFHTQSLDLTLTSTHRLETGETATALNIQEQYHQACARYVAAECATDSEPARVLALWGTVLDDAKHDPAKLVGRIDWATKHSIINAFVARHQLEPLDPRVQMIDIQYHDLRVENGLYYRMRERGRIERILTDEEISEASTQPPHSTRAFFRGEAIRRFGEAILAAGWDAIVFKDQADALRRVTLPDPRLGTARDTQPLFAKHDTLDGLLDELLLQERMGESLG